MTITLSHLLRGALVAGFIAATAPSLASDVVTRNVRCYGLDPVPEPKVQEAAAKADGIKAADADRTEAKPKPRRKPYRTMTTASCAAAGGSLGPSR